VRKRALWLQGEAVSRRAAARGSFASALAWAAVTSPGYGATPTPGRLAPATLAAIQGGVVLTQTRRDRQQLRIALDAACAYLRSSAPDPRPAG
jgi:hypothetical protein